MSYRIQKVNQLIKKEVNKFILQEIDFAEIIVTITDVDTSPDLSQAKIRMTVLPIEKSELALEIINRNIFQMQKFLNKELTMRKVPRIKFEIDQTEIKAQRVEEILEKLKNK